MEELNIIKEKGCPCGKEHIHFNSRIIVGKDALLGLSAEVRAFDAKKVFVLSDKNTFKAAGERVLELLEKDNIAFYSYSFNEEHPEPDEYHVGLAAMYFNPSFDIIIGVGSGVINDISKIISSISGKPYIIVATAPSMDGYASATSSVTREGLKISLNSKSADVIIGDTDVLCKAPVKLMQAGLGDMLAKYVSICEWRLSQLITGEYYCEDIAELVRTSLKKCISLADGLLSGDGEAVEAVFKGLIICGVCMSYAGLSRPASGVEHYFSHVWDMRGVCFNSPVELHGIQCALGTLIAIRLYEQVKILTPDREKALEYVNNFNVDKWNETLRAFLGKSAESMILQEQKEGKYDKEKHKRRLDVIINHWYDIIEIIEEELPSSKEIETLLDRIGLIKTPEDMGLSKDILPLTFKATKDIRDKYVLSRLCWDLGILDDLTL